MAAQNTPYGGANKRRAKKKKSRTEVSSSSESDSDVPTKKSRKSEDVDEKSASPIPEITPGSTKKSKKPKPSIDEVEPKTEPLQPSSSSPSPAPPSIKKSKKKSKPAADEDVPMTDAPEPTTKKSKSPQEDFSAIYLRKIAAELADDLDKVREAQDFKANSVPMLIHALKQGESMFSAEEKRRVVGAAGQ